MHPSDNHVQNGKIGSAAERFLRRKPKSLLPNSMEREVDLSSMLEKRTNEQTKLATKKEKKSSPIVSKIWTHLFKREGDICCRHFTENIFRAID